MQLEHSNLKPHRVPLRGHFTALISYNCEHNMIERVLVTNSHFNFPPHKTQVEDENILCLMYKISYKVLKKHE